MPKNPEQETGDQNAPLVSDAPAVKNKGGRPCLLTPEAHDLLVADALIGLPLTISALGVPTTRQTVNNWRREGAADFLADKDTAKARFFSAYARALRKWGAEKWAEWDGSDPGESTALREKLLIRFPPLSPKHRVELTGDDGGPVKVESSPIAALDAALGGKPE